MDKKDIQLLKLLQNDARMPYKKIAEKLKVSEGTVYNRLDKLKKSGILLGFEAKIDYDQLGYKLTAVIGIRVRGMALVKVEGEISKLKNVLCTYDITGDYDAIIIAKFRSRSDLNTFIKKILKISEVERTYTQIVLNTGKEDLRLDI